MLPCDLSPQLRRNAPHAATWSCLLLMLWLAATPALAAPAEYAIGPAPAWVRPVESPARSNLPPEQLSGGVHYLLSDVQVRVDADGGRSTYRHLAIQPVNQTGVEDAAQVAISFDPAYEKLTLHSIGVVRGKAVRSQLQAAAIKVLQREKQLEYRIYDGGKTASVFLDDVRAGDVIDYAYTIEGANPIFAGIAFGSFGMEWTVPVQRSTARLLWPLQGRSLHLKPRNAAPAPRIHEEGGWREYNWESADVPAQAAQTQTPSWYDPYARVSWSAFDDWAAVARWALPLYATDSAHNPELREEVERIAAAYSSPGDRMLAVLRFVQREIRYLGVEIGANSHRPSPPDSVLARRFGDCKDKTLLTLSMLAALGVEARAALVSTDIESGIGDELPSPGVFDHVIVRARIDGRTFWIDPTRPAQNGDLDHLYQPDFGRALVIDAATTEPVVMGAAPASLYRRRMEATFDSSAGFDGPVAYTIRTEHEGASAEEMRGRLASNSREELQKQYLNFYAQDFPGIKVAQRMDVVEEEKLNRVTTTEHYLIDAFWKPDEANKRRIATIATPDISAYFSQARQSVRTAPLAVSHPVVAEQVTRVNLPQTWAFKPETTVVDDPAFRFVRSDRLDDKQVTLTDHFESRLDHVEAADVGRYLANVQKAQDAFGYQLYWNEGAAAAQAAAPASVMDRFNWTLATLAAMALLIYGALAQRLYRYDPDPVPGKLTDSSLAGFSGWLIIPTIGVMLSPLRILYDCYQLLPSYGTDVWSVLTTSTSAQYHPLWAPALLFEMVANLGLVVLSWLLLVVYFQRRRLAPRLYIAMLASSGSIQALDLWISTLIPAAASEVDPKLWSEMFRTFFALFLWGSYFLVSVRVRSTFTRRWGEPPASAPTSARSAPSIGVEDSAVLAPPAAPAPSPSPAGPPLAD